MPHRMYLDGKLVADTSKMENPPGGDPIKIADPIFLCGRSDSDPNRHFSGALQFDASCNIHCPWDTSFHSLAPAAQNLHTHASDTNVWHALNSRIIRGSPLLFAAAGRMANVAFWDKALSEDEVRRIYQDAVKMISVEEIRSFVRSSNVGDRGTERDRPEGGSSGLTTESRRVPKGGNEPMRMARPCSHASHFWCSARSLT